jgi:hypothetical protein
VKLDSIWRCPTRLIAQYIFEDKFILVDVTASIYQKKWVFLKDWNSAEAYAWEKL